MKEAFYEESANARKGATEAKKYTVLHVIGVICFVVAVMHGLFSFTYVPMIINETSGVGLALSLVWWFGLLAMFVFLGFIMFRWKRKYNLSYDYIFVEDELRISKVFNGKKRKHLITIKADQILRMGKCESDAYERTRAGIEKKPIFCTSNVEPAEDKMFIYIVVSNSVGKSIYVLECRLTMLEFLVRAAGRNKLELS
ncbi:MAG: hypothetical protein J6C93_04665 [Clostridia bacterium]|nr:hypothetical protein [Clostridia bacterium]